MADSAVPSSVPRSVGATEGVAQEAVDIVEEIFLPRPGGMIERHRREQERKDEQRRERENAAENVEERSYKSVKVTVLSPEVSAINVVTIQPGASAMILPNSPYRYSAQIQAVKGIGAGNITIAKDSSQALGGVGFPLVAGQLFTVHSRGQLYAFNPDQVNTVSVAVFVEIYGPEK
jgi:hypothetical protein